MFFARPLFDGRIKKALRFSPSGVGIRSSSKSVIPKCDGRGTPSSVLDPAGKLRGYMSSLVRDQQRRIALHRSTHFCLKYNNALATAAIPEDTMTGIRR